MSERGRLRAGLGAYRYLVASWTVLVFYKTALAAAPYRWVEKVVPAGHPQANAPAWVIARTRWAVSAASKAAFNATCLPQALAGRTLLAMQGYDSVIRIGVRRADDGGVQAHAWLLSGDSVVVGDDGERLDSFSPLTDLRSGA